MRISRHYIIWILLIGMLSSAKVMADVPHLLTFQGRMRDSTGVPFSGGKLVKFVIYDGAGVAIWNSEFQSVIFTDGMATVSLGSPPQPPLPSGPWASDTGLSLGITVDTDPEISPRIRFTSGGFAFHSLDADKLDGQDAAAFAEAAHTHALDGLFDVIAPTPANGQVLTFQSGAGVWEPTSAVWEGDGASVYLTDPGHRVGIGTASPGYALDVVEPGGGAFVARHSSDNLAASILMLENRSNGTTWEHAVAGANGAFGGSVASKSMYFYRQGSADVPLVIDSLDRVGIGAVPSNARLWVAGGDERYSGFFDNTGASDSIHVVHAEYSGGTAVNAVAVYGRSAPADYYGIGGWFEGGFYGLYGVARGEGIAQASYTGVGAVAEGNSLATKYALSATATGGGTKYGIRAQAQGSGTNYALYGAAAGGSTNWAGYFAGNVHVNGTLSKSAGSFKIDHPLDPANKYLQHSFVESPDMKNIYDGVTILDGEGRAEVTLPEWFDALNRDFRYQLTCIGGFAPVYIETEVAGNRFAIAGGKPGMKVSWMVTGIRKDNYAEAHRIEVEVAKGSDEQGKYLHPELLGFAREQGVGYRPEAQGHHDRLNKGSR